MGPRQAPWADTSPAADATFCRVGCAHGSAGQSSRRPGGAEDAILAVGRVTDTRERRLPALVGDMVEKVPAPARTNTA